MNNLDKIENHVIECVEKLRNEWNLGDSPIANIRSLVNSKDFLLIIFPSNQEYDGITFQKYESGKLINCIYCNSNRPIGRINFTIAHEIYHAYFEKSSFDKITKGKGSDEIEKKAEIFAGHFLIPRNHLISELKKNVQNNKQITLSNLFNMQKIYGVTFQALVAAITKLYFTEYRHLVPKNIWDMRKYYDQENWDEIEELIKSFDNTNLLNSCTLEFYIPEELKEIIRNNFYKNKTEKETAEALLSFFKSEL